MARNFYMKAFNILLHRVFNKIVRPATSFSVHSSLHFVPSWSATLLTKLLNHKQHYYKIVKLLSQTD